MPTPTQQLLSRTVYDADGITANWNFSFAGGYIDPSHVKAYVTNSLGAQIPTTGTLIGGAQFRIFPVVTIGNKVTIYRDTPKDTPLVNFSDGAGLSEEALDTVAQQAVFCAAEAIDTVTTSGVGAALDAAAQATAAATAILGQVAAANAAAATAIQARIDAVAAQVAAAASATAAGTSATNAANSASAAATSATNASTAGATAGAAAGTTAANAVIGSKADLASPTFTGDPKAPTPVTTDNDTSIATTAFVQAILASLAVLLAGTQTITGQKTFNLMPILPAQSMVRLYGSPGNGSTNTVIRRFSTVVTSQGTDITYADSATLGALFTVNVAGVYSISYSDALNTAANLAGLSLNTSSPTTAYQSLPVNGQHLAVAQTPANGYATNTCWTGYLPAGSLIRAHTDGGTAVGTSAFQIGFTIARIG